MGGAGLSQSRGRILRHAPHRAHPAPNHCLSPSPTPARVHGPLRCHSLHVKKCFGAKRGQQCSGGAKAKTKKQRQQAWGNNSSSSGKRRETLTRKSNTHTLHTHSHTAAGTFLPMLPPACTTLTSSSLCAAAACFSSVAADEVAAAWGMVLRRGLLHSAAPLHLLPPFRQSRGAAHVRRLPCPRLLIRMRTSEGGPVRAVVTAHSRSISTAVRTTSRVRRSNHTGDALLLGASWHVAFRLTHIRMISRMGRIGLVHRRLLTACASVVLCVRSSSPPQRISPSPLLDQLSQAARQATSSHVGSFSCSAQQRGAAAAPC